LKLPVQTNFSLFPHLECLTCIKEHLVPVVRRTLQRQVRTAGYSWSPLYPSSAWEHHALSLGIYLSRWNFSISDMLFFFFFIP